MDNLAGGSYGYGSKYLFSENIRHYRDNEGIARVADSFGLEQVMSVHNQAIGTAGRTGEATHDETTSEYCAAQRLKAAQRWVTDAIKYIDAIEHGKTDAERLVQEVEQKLDKIMMEIRKLNISFLLKLKLINRNTTFIEDKSFESAYEQFNKKSFHKLIELTHLYNDCCKRKTHFNYCDYQLLEAYQNKHRAYINILQAQNNFSK